MLVISSREFRANQGKYFTLAAEGANIILKSRNKGSFRLIPVSEDDTVLRIPEEFRCDPYTISPSGDPFWADIRNVEELNKRFEYIKTGKAKTVAALKDKDEIKKFLDSL